MKNEMEKKTQSLSVSNVFYMCVLCMLHKRLAIQLSTDAMTNFKFADKHGEQNLTKT